jgi:hypothetical protein
MLALFRLHRFVLPRAALCMCSLVAIFTSASTTDAVEWVQPGANADKPIWGLRGGLQFAIPRGLIRIGYPTLPDVGYDLINFIAIEPVVKGRRGFSELERSAIDNQQGKWIWAGEAATDAPPAQTHNPGKITVLDGGVEELTVPLTIEQFENGAHVRLVLSQRSDAPDELRLRVHAQPGSAPMDRCILTVRWETKRAPACSGSRVDRFRA